MTAAPSDDALFSTIERFHGSRAWGRVLDAGTGVHSLEWIRSLDTRGWTAVTGALARQNALESRLGPDGIRDTDRIVTGNWTDETLLHG